ncbi:MAG: alpha/beta fold hydrolase [Bacteroidota bacterium]
MLINRVIWILAVCAFLYLLSLLLVYLLEDRFVFRPTGLSDTHQFEFDHRHEERFWEAEDGTRIHSLFFPAQGVKKGIVLYFHGNADNLQRWGRYTVDFTSRGYDVWAVDYRGYGKSGGQVDEDWFYKDAYQMYQQCREEYEPQEIVLYGRSLGSAVATHLAAQVRARLLILETPFDNIQSVFHAQMPVSFLPFRLKNQFPNDQFIQRVQYPICIVHGTADDLVPLQSALQLKPLLKSGDKFSIIEKGGHKNLRTFEEYQLLLDHWLGVDEFKDEG